MIHLRAVVACGNIAGLTHTYRQTLEDPYQLGGSAPLACYVAPGCHAGRDQTITSRSKGIQLMTHLTSRNQFASVTAPARQTVILPEATTTCALVRPAEASWLMRDIDWP